MFVGNLILNIHTTFLDDDVIIMTSSDNRTQSICVVFSPSVYYRNSQAWVIGARSGLQLFYRPAPKTRAMPDNSPCVHRRAQGNNIFCCAFGVDILSANCRYS